MEKLSCVKSSTFPLRQNVDSSENNLTYQRVLEEAELCMVENFHEQIEPDQ